MDFIEFLQNEEKYHRQVIYDKNLKRFSVGEKIIYYCDVYGNLKSFKNDNPDTNKYCIKERVCDNNQPIWYIIKDEYFTGYYLEINDNVVALKTKEIEEKDINFVKAEIDKNNNLSTKEKRRNSIITIFGIIIIGCTFVAVLTHEYNKMSSGFGDMLSSCNVLTSITSNGTYYLKNKGTGTLNTNVYIKLNNGKFEDSDGIAGTYEISKGKITFYVEVYGEKTEFLSGTIENGTITIRVLNSTTTYVKQ